MGIQDIISQLGGQGGQKAAIEQIHKLFGGQGIQGVVTQMTNAGLGHQVQSWIGMGDNLPVSGQQLQQAMDPAALQQMAQSTGLPPAQIADHVAQVLPHIVDQATPDGQMPMESGAMPKGAKAAAGAAMDSGSGMGSGSGSGMGSGSSMGSGSGSGMGSGSGSSGSSGSASGPDSSKSTYNR
jgi:uncharacterized protein YidB (DUF937 family)